MWKIHISGVWVRLRDLGSETSLSPMSQGGQRHSVHQAKQLALELGGQGLTRAGLERRAGVVAIGTRGWGTGIRGAALEGVRVPLRAASALAQTPAFQAACEKIVLKIGYFFPS